MAADENPLERAFMARIRADAYREALAALQRADAYREALAALQQEFNERPEGSE